MTQQIPTLMTRMRDLADSGHSSAVQLRQLATEAETALLAEPFDARQALSTWARARQLWCSCTEDYAL